LHLLKRGNSDKKFEEDHGESGENLRWMSEAIAPWLHEDGNGCQGVSTYFSTH
jgi:hypothetical protein